MLATLLIGLLAQGAGDDPARFAKDIQAFEEQDRRNPPAEDTIFFVGSSTIRMWDLPKSFPNLKVLNRGFGGSMYSDVAFYLDRIVTPYKPKTIVLYTGDNDVANGKTAETVFADFKRVIDRIRAVTPKTRIIVLAVKPGPARWSLYPVAKEFNARVAEYAKGDPDMRYVETSGTILGADGQPRKEMFIADGLHLNGAGYAAWTALLMPYLAPPAQ